MSKTIYIIKETVNYGDYEVPDINVVGFCETKEDAEELCAKLNKEEKLREDFFVEHGRQCIAGCEAWPVNKVGEKKAQKSLEKCKKLKCPKADLYVSEVLYGDDHVSGGLEVRCRNKSDDCSDAEPRYYEVEEINRLSLSEEGEK